MCLIFGEGIDHYQRYSLQYSSLYNHYLKDFEADIESLIARVLIIKSKAGYGKTNLICDFSNKFLLRNDLCFLYLTGRDFNQLSSPDTIESYLQRSVFSDQHHLSDLEMLVSLKYKHGYLFIIIDGINENNDLPRFALALEQFIQRSKNQNIKLILTCRTEYFDDRFGNLTNLDGVRSIVLEENKIPDTHQEYLVQKYFNFFGIGLDLSRVSDQVFDTFVKDKLILRFFCEAYKDEQKLSHLNGLYRLEIFERYLEKQVNKIENLEEALLEISQYIINERQFSDIPLERLTAETRGVIEAAYHENILITRLLYFGIIKPTQQ